MSGVQGLVHVARLCLVLALAIWGYGTSSADTINDSSDGAKLVQALNANDFPLWLTRPLGSANARWTGSHGGIEITIDTGLREGSMHVYGGARKTQARWYDDVLRSTFCKLPCVVGIEAAQDPGGWPFARMTYSRVGMERKP